MTKSAAAASQWAALVLTGPLVQVLDRRHKKEGTETGAGSTQPREAPPSGRATPETPGSRGPRRHPRPQGGPVGRTRAHGLQRLT
eukprot:9025741-Alexandrium_andersonii.AAC.1